MDKHISSTIIESMSDGLIVLDFHGKIAHMNPAASELLGISLDETGDKTYFELFMDEPGNDAFNDLLIDGIQHGETRLYGEVPFRRRDGRFLDLAVTTSFLREESTKGQKTGIVVVFKDITEFKALDRARRRVLDHLSHELKTPLSIILTSLKKLESPENERSMGRIRRNLERLQDIQMEVEDIVNQGSFEEKRAMAPWLEQMLDLVEILDERKSIDSEALDFLRERIGKFFKLRNSGNEDINLNQLIQQVIASAKDLCSHRNVELTAEFEGDIHIRIDPQVFEKTLMGIIKNAIENTPDGGDITVSLRQTPERIELEIQDTGIGITAESQKQIFGGFYHSLETDLYSTKRPFEFGAGGKGLDLLRIKIFSETYNFQVNCRSTRCQYIPLEKDVCPGDIAKCPHIKTEEECAQSGGTSFKIAFERET